jgi:hypothetical protein
MFILFYFNSHRTNRRVTCIASENAQPNSEISISTHTNCIIICIWVDGIYRTPSILFTCNSEFRMDKADTERKKDKLELLLDLLIEYEIDADRVICIATNKNETGSKIGKSSEPLR